MSENTSKDYSRPLTEYSATHDAYLHYDNFSWQVGSVLIAGVFVFWGFLMQIPPQDAAFILTVSCVFVALVMSVWFLYTAHNRQIYLQKLDRIHKLERLLGFEQHLGWKRKEASAPPTYQVFGPSGHFLDTFIYFLSCAIVPILGWARVCYSPWSLSAFVIALGVVLWVQVNQRALANHRINVAQTSEQNT